MAGPEGGFSVTIDPTEWYRLKADLDKFDPALSRALRRRIKNAGQVAADEVKKTLREPSPAGGDDSGEGRAALIAATRVSVSFGNRTAGAKIVTSSSKLSAEHKGLLNVYNKASFRHPVYGNKDNWVAQSGRPYFGSVIQQVLNKEIIREIDAALDEAIVAIGGRVL